MSAVRGRWHSRTTAISRSTRGWGDFRISVSASRRPRRSSKRSGSPAPSSEPSAVSRAVSSCVASGPGVPVTATRSARRRTSIVSSREEREVEPARRGIRDPLERVRRLAPDEGAGQGPGGLGAAAAQELLHGARPDPSLAVRERRVEQRQRVPEAPVGRAREEPERVGLDRVGRHLLLLEDPPERLADLGARDGPEVEALAAREDRRGQAPRLRGGEDEDDVRRRLLQGLQERVERRLREHVDFVDDVDLAPPAGRRVARVLAEGPHLVDPAIRGAVDLEHVERAARRHLAAGLALGAGDGTAGAPPLAVQAHREEPRRRRLAHAPRAGEQVRVGDALLREGVLERPDDRRLADHRVEGQRSPAPRENLIAHREPTPLGVRLPVKGKWPCTRRRWPTSCDLPGPTAPARESHGTREGLRTVAPFRAWRGWQILVAWGPAFITASRGSIQHAGTSGGDSASLERIASTGHRYLPA